MSHKGGRGPFRRVYPNCPGRLTPAIRTFIYLHAYPITVLFRGSCGFHQIHLHLKVPGSGPPVLSFDATLFRGPVHPLSILFGHMLPPYSKVYIPMTLIP